MKSWDLRKRTNHILENCKPEFNHPNVCYVCSGKQTECFTVNFCVAQIDDTWLGSCIKSALPQVTVTSQGPVNWSVVYPTVLSTAALGP